MYELHLRPFEMLQCNLERTILRRFDGRLAAGKRGIIPNHHGEVKAHFTMFCKSAPEKPGVPLARTIGSASKSKR